MMLTDKVSYAAEQQAFLITPPPNPTASAAPAPSIAVAARSARCCKVIFCCRGRSEICWSASQCRTCCKEGVWLASSEHAHQHVTEKALPKTTGVFQHHHIGLFSASFLFSGLLLSRWSRIYLFNVAVP